MGRHARFSSQFQELFLGATLLDLVSHLVPIKRCQVDIISSGHSSDGTDKHSPVGLEPKLQEMNQ